MQEDIFQKPKFVFVTGGVMSGLGKGATVASTAKLLKLAGLKVTIAKIDPYLNVDAGTMNPLVHGEVFVTDDGGECDMDLGTYERFLDANLTREHNLTTGQVYQEVIRAERRGNYLGSCVQIIPHISDEIKKRLRQLALSSGVDILLVECGGTVGDMESLPFLEAFRQMRMEEGPEGTLFIHVTLAPTLDPVGEVKTKPTQHSVQELRRIGIQPDIIVVRSATGLPPDARKKISLFTSVDADAVISNPDLKSVYLLPTVLAKDGIMKPIFRKLQLPPREVSWGTWPAVISGFVEFSRTMKVAMVGKYVNLADSYVSVNHSLRHAAANLRVGLNLDWIDSERFEKESPECLKDYDGVVIPGGFGKRGSEGKIAVADYTRVNDIPYLGLCFGFQLATVAFARSVVGLKNANSSELDPDTLEPVVDLLPEQSSVREMGGTMRLGGHDITLKPGTKARIIYGSDVIRRRHRHRFEINPKFRPLLEERGAVFSGFSDGGRRAEILELPQKRFYMATQFHPEFSSRPGAPEQVFQSFMETLVAGSARTAS
ncbi:MAG: CTP synthase [Conexivisphaerales archaeon]